MKSSGLIATDYDPQLRPNDGGLNRAMIRHIPRPPPGMVMDGSRVAINAFDTSPGNSTSQGSVVEARLRDALDALQHDAMAKVPGG